MPLNTVTQNIPESPVFADAVASDDLVWVWDTSTGVLRRCKVSDLPFSNGGNGPGNGSGLTGTPFKVNYNAPNAVFTGGNLVITDLRLSGKTGYPVYATQLNAELRDDDVVYDSIDGKLTIKNFNLKIGEHITLYPDGMPGSTSSSGNSPALQAILDRLDVLELIAAVFTPSALGAKGGMVLWRKPAGEIPAGWAEVVDWRGKMAMGYDPNDPDFDTLSPNASDNSSGGEKEVAITGAHIPAHRHFTLVDQSIATNSFPNEVGRALSKIKAVITSWSKPRGGSESYVLYGAEGDIGSANGEPTVSPTSAFGSDAPEHFKLLNPYRIVMYIEFIGI